MSEESDEGRVYTVSIIRAHYRGANTGSRREKVEGRSSDRVSRTLLREPTLVRGWQ